MSAHETYKIFAQYYDTYVQHFDEDLALYTSLCKPGGKILEVGCGTGRVLQYLLNQGFHLTGVDISKDMLDIARKKLRQFQQAGGLDLRLHNFIDAPLSEKYDTSLITFYTCNYIFKAVERFLQNIRKSMDKDSLLILDLFYPKTLHHPELEDVWIEHEFSCDGEMITLKDKRTFSNGVEERIQIYQREDSEETRITTQRKYYSPTTIKNLLEGVGFKNILFSENYDMNNFKERLLSQQIITHFVVKAMNGL